MRERALETQKTAGCSSPLQGTSLPVIPRCNRDDWDRQIHLVKRVYYCNFPSLNRAIAPRSANWARV